VLGHASPSRDQPVNDAVVTKTFAFALYLDITPLDLIGPPR
jgi:hypothetical protein